MSSMGSNISPTSESSTSNPGHCFLMLPTPPLRVLEQSLHNTNSNFASYSLKASSIHATNSRVGVFVFCVDSYFRQFFIKFVNFRGAKTFKTYNGFKGVKLFVADSVVKTICVLCSLSFFGAFRLKRKFKKHEHAHKASTSFERSHYGGEARCTRA